MKTAEIINREVQSLPEDQAREVLDFVEFLKSKRSSGNLAARKTALEGLARLRGRYKAVKFSRDELHDRAGLR